ncbi:DUF3137 domain-containing protein [Pedobacter sp. ASV12]|uniref:DUF3137 domain-containing protein n=1 Tax=Pedobacter sp. ASV12 TaxID=2795120 RepID=UPI0018ED9616|nr:DUF3137 domain-containing protein [Pedobacter sp. ASV12]
MDVNYTQNGKLQSVLAELEVERKKVLSANTQGYGAIILGIVLIVALAVMGLLVAGMVTGLAAIIFGGVILFRISDAATDYKNRFKMDVVGALLSNVDQSLTIQPDRGIVEGEFRQSQLFTTDPDRYSTEDLISGKIGNTSIYFAEVHAEYKTETQGKNGRQEHWHDILKGIVFVADFNKNFNGVTAIRPKDFGSSIGAWFAKNIYSFGDKNIVELENEAFNKNFVTYSTDQIEARYILTPALMDRLCELNQRAAYAISVSFVNSNMYIAFPLAKNYFEAPLFKSLLNADALNEDLSVLHFMYAIVQELDLNTRIWTKQ